MFKNFFIFFLLQFLIIFFSPSALAVEPPNLGLLKQAINQYHDSGAYETDISLALNQAYDYLQMRLEQNPDQRKLAIVMDIDDTALEFYSFMKVNDFSSRPDLIIETHNKPNVPPIMPVLTFYNFALQHNVAIFFITGRPENSTAITKIELSNAGYKNWSGIYLRTPKDNGHTTIEFKAAIRKKITEMGYDIVLNIGDQYNDLAGGYAERIIKLPNPFYITP